MQRCALVRSPSFSAAGHDSLAGHAWHQRPVCVYSPNTHRSTPPPSSPRQVFGKSGAAPPAATAPRAMVLDLPTNARRTAAQETNRILILHEHPRTGGLAGEISAIINEQAFEYLDAPIARVTAPDTPVPYAPTLEDAYIPDVRQITAACGQLLAY